MTHPLSEGLRELADDCEDYKPMTTFVPAMSAKAAAALRRAADALDEVSAARNIHEACAKEQSLKVRDLLAGRDELRRQLDDALRGSPETALDLRTLRLRVERAEAQSARYRDLLEGLDRDINMADVSTESERLRLADFQEQIRSALREPDEAAAPVEPGTEEKCPDCNGTGAVDSGGVYPWGGSISIPCGCVREPETCNRCGLMVNAPDCDCPSEEKTDE